MSDLINRQAAIDALHMHLMYRMGTDSNKKRLDDWINGVPSVQPEQRWIPCSERLPEKWGDYLVTIKWKGVESGNVYTETNMAVYDERAKEWDCNDVIAWMPLPDAFEEDK